MTIALAKVAPRPQLFSHAVHGFGRFGNPMFEEDDGAGNQLPNAAAEAAAAAALAATEAAKAAEANKNKPSDKEAELLKEVMKRKEDQAKTKLELETLRNLVGDLNIEEARKLIGEQKTNEEKALEAKGDYERLKARMVEEHTKTVTDLQTKLEALSADRNKDLALIDTLVVGSKFNESKFVSEELTIPSAKAKTLYGAHFDIEDGKVVGYDKPRGSASRTAFVDGFGAPLSFDASMQKVIEADSDRDQLLRSKIKQGSGSGGKPPADADGSGSKRKSSSDASGVDKIGAGLSAFFKK